MIRKIQSRINVQDSRQSLLPVLFLVLLAFVAAFNLVYVTWFQQVTQDRSGTDFHAYWFNGHYIRQGTNPYTAYRLGSPPEQPVSYLDGYIDAEAPVGYDLSRSPAQLWMTILLSPFSYLSWPNARNLWVALNLAVVFIAPLILARLLPAQVNFRPLHIAAMVLAFAAMGGVLETIYRGQTALLVITLVLFSILMMENRPIVSGIALGIAFSKITLVIPFLLIFFWRRKVIPVFIAVLLQLLGLLLVSRLRGDGLETTSKVYFAIVTNHISYNGIHLMGQLKGEAPGAASFGSIAFLPDWMGSNLLSIIVMLSGFLLMALILSNHRGLIKGGAGASGPRLTILELELLVIFSLISLLTVYHRIYDTIILLLLFPLLVVWRPRIEGLSLALPLKLLFFLFVLVTLVMLLFPRQLELALPAVFRSRVVYEPLALTYALILALGLSLAMNLLFREDLLFQGVRDQELGE